MIGKITSFLLGDKMEEANEYDQYKELLETEEGEWVVVNVHESCPVVQLEMGSLENLLIEHPSMSVYNMRGQSSDQEEEEDEDTDAPSVQTEIKTVTKNDVTKESARSRKRKADVAIYLQDPDEEVAEMTKKKQYEIQTCWSSATGCTSPCRLLPTPDKEVDEPVIMNTGSCMQYRFKNIFVTPVCEVYKLHRETFYLAQDFFDRFMATQTDVVKTRLQLIGIASLFVAAKLEEIYPPKLYQFAYVTDGACTEDEILDMELIVMKELKWSLSPLTTLSWLNIYMQVAYLKENTETSKLLIPHYPQATFVQIAELMDLCVLDVGCLEYAYGVLAASALFHFSSLELVQKVSGFEWRDIEECVRWMVPFAMSIREVGSSGLKKFKGISPEDTHNIQTHSVLLEWLDRASAHRAVCSEKGRNSPVPSGVLTPPQSSEKTEMLKS
ncbi:G1/S-specific cyclin-E1 [Acipenser ruthenus]|uniref:G1/S-specific cyclin-E1 n=1 Tax=Acipenser ruthenus TaxID=7906 RepID=A0A662YLM9_ACIRT|nr:G1/S-specific cyclin-E1 [Acipenser ruthenus]